MKCEPYVTPQERRKRFYAEASKLLGLEEAHVNEGYLDFWRIGIEGKNFIKMIKKGEITKKDFERIVVTDEMRERHQELLSSSLMDHIDILHYRLKQVVMVGDEVVCAETKRFTFGGGKKYLTKGRRYKIIELYDKDEPLTEFGFIASTDLPKERWHGGVCGIKSLWRDGAEIWNWHLAWLELFVDQNPGHAQLADVQRKCRESAKLSRRGVDE